MVARIGGDEFVVLLAETGDRITIETIVQRILKCLTPVPFDHNAISTAASVGIAVHPNDGRNWQEVYKAADVALYQAKHGGRATWPWYKENAAAVLQDPR